MNNSKILTSTLTLFATLLVGNAFAQDFSFKPDQGTVTFDAVGRPKAIKIHGEGSGPEGTLSKTGKLVSGTLKFKLATLKTGIARRDKHMTEKYLETDKFPEAELTLSDLPLFPADTFQEIKEASLKGNLTLKGVTKAVEGLVTVTKLGPTYKVKASFPLKLSEFKIEIPKHLGITVAEDVQVTITANVQEGKKP
jgi:polyisoprenoid-binding protein YceI